MEWNRLESHPVKSRHIFFDIGNTLATGFEISARRVLAAGLDLSEKEMKRAGRLLMTCPGEDPAVLAGALREILPNHGPALIENALAVLWDEQYRCMTPVPGAAGLIEALKADGFRLGVISNIWHPAFLGFQRACPSIVELLDSITLSYREGCKKPSSTIYRRALESAGADPGNCWMVGDSYELDMEPARLAGMKTLWVLCRPEREKVTVAEIINGKREKPDLVVTGMDELMDFHKEKGFET
jgi:HAD superfamily hydrolase (TIGR01549 family)